MQRKVPFFLFMAKPYMSKMSYEVARSLEEAILRMNSQFEYVSNRLRSRRQSTEGAGLRVYDRKREHSERVNSQRKVPFFLFMAKPYMSKMSYEVARSLEEAILRMNSQFEYVSNRLRSRR